MELRRPKAARLLSPLALALSVSLLAAGCSSDATAPPRSTTATTIPGGYLLETNGTVTVGVRSLPTNFNPASVAGDNRVTQMVMEQVWPQPFVTDPSFGVESSGLLSSAEVESVLPLKVVYAINPQAVWSDGVPITVSDFIYNWHEHLANSALLAQSGLVAGYRDIASIVGSNGGRTMTVTFSRPFSQWQSLFADLVPAHIGEKYGWSAAFAGFSPKRVVSGGPFEISSYKPHHELTLSRNPHYWGSAAHVARIRFVLERSNAALVSALQSGSVTIGEVSATAPSAGVLGAGSVGVAGVSPALATATERSSLVWSSAAGDQVWQLCFNLDDPTTSQIDMRLGVEHSLDRSTIVADSEQLVDPKIRVSVSRLTLPGEATSASTSGASPVVERAPDLYQPTTALASFRAAGYEPGAGGLLRLGGTGPALGFSLLEPSDDWPIDQAGLVIQAELLSIGVRVDLEQRKLSRILSTSLPKGFYELALVPFEVTPSEVTAFPEYTNPVLHPSAPIPPVTPLSGGTSGAAGVTTTTGLPWTTQAPAGTEPGAVAAGGVTRDVTGFDGAAVALDLNDAMSELNPSTALSYLQKAEDELWADAVTIPLFQPGFDLVRSVRIDNVSESPTWAGPMWDAQDWAILKQVPKTTSTTTSQAR